MQLLSFTAVLAAAILGAQALPTTTNPSTPLLKRTGTDTCNGQTWENDTSDSSPTVQDCQTFLSQLELFSDIAIPVYSTGFVRLGGYGSCIFGVQQQTATEEEFVVGGQNMIDLITLSIAAFQSNGRVAASGYMTCNSLTASAADGYMAEVYWKIY